MFLIGETRDQKVCEKLIETLASESIVLESHTNHEGMYQLFVANESEFARAHDLFRDAHGLGPLKTQEEMPPEWKAMNSTSWGPVNIFMVVTCIMFFAAPLIVDKQILHENLMFSAAKEDELFSLIKMGEFWRLLTPVFLHAGLIHIAFNLMWLKDLGKAIEANEGPIGYLILFIFTGVISNFFQYLSVGPNFLGMSGVIFGFVGFLWMKKTFLPESKYGLPKRDIMFLVGYLVVCMSGVLMIPIANVAHAVGLAVGMLYGLLRAIMLGGKIDLKRITLFLLLAIVLSLASFYIDSWRQGGAFYLKF